MTRTVRNCVRLVGLVVALTGCEAENQIVLASRCFDIKTETYVCCDPDTPRSWHMCDAGADVEVDAGTDASDGGEVDASDDDGGPPVCPWTCTSTGGGGFNPYPSYVWVGNETDPPPQKLSGLAWTSWVGVEFAEPSCPTCSCAAPSAPEDGCVLPAVWNAESTMCQDPSSPQVTPFDPPLNWAGACTSANPIAAEIMCDGEPCVKSLVVKPPTIAPCIAEPAMPPEGQTLPPPKRTKVIDYVTASTLGTCEGNGTTNCIAPPPAGYKLCFVADDLQAVAACPEGWTDRYTGWREVSDTRACSVCTCGSPQDASCKVRAKVYADDACSDEAGSLVLSSSEETKCGDLFAGTALGSKTAEILSYQAGTCAPSTSEIIGATMTDRAVTYCCVPEPKTPK